MMKVSITQTASAAVIRNATAMRCSKYDIPISSDYGCTDYVPTPELKEEWPSACKRYRSPAAWSDRRRTSSASKRMHGGFVAVYSRSGSDLTDRFTLIPNAIAAPPRMLTASAGVIDPL